MKRLILFLFSCFVSSICLAQSCPNIGFEDSSFVGWQGLRGQYIDTLPSMAGGTYYSVSPGFDPTGHVIMSGSDFDPYTDSTVTTVAPGFDFSVRLGNDSIARRTAWLRYTTTVDSNNLLFVYSVAIILQDPGNNHQTDQRPGFFVRVMDTSGNELDTICGRVWYIVEPNIPGFKNWSQDTNIKYRPWSVAGLDLSPYFGQDVTVEFISRDCSVGGHFGYAYINGSCYPRELQVDYCSEQADSIIINAPFGFDYLWSTGDTTRTIQILADSADTLYTCTLTSSLTGCSFVLGARPEPTVFSNFSIQETSCGEATFQTTLQINQGSIASYFWDFGDPTTNSDTSSSPQPSYTYPEPGKYEVSLIATNRTGCVSDTFTDSVNIYFSPIAAFDSDTVCFEKTTTFTNESVVSNNVRSQFLWDFADGSPIDSSFSPTHQYSEDTTLVVTLVVWSDSVQCSDTFTREIVLNPLPQANFIWNDPDSCVPHEVHFINQSSYQDSSSIVDFKWDFGNEQFSKEKSPTYVYSESGSFTPKLVVTDTFGCTDSVDFPNAIKVANIPYADFSASPNEAHISNATIGFTNLSRDADGYLWAFGDESNTGASFSSEEEPIWTFSSGGIHNVQLTAFSDLNCFDTASLNILIIDDRISLSNIITANGDGINDVFRFELQTSSVTDFRCNIYNRWGALIYETVDPSFSWDGRINGEFATPGSYFYVIEYKGYKDENFNFQGYITVTN